MAKKIQDHIKSTKNIIFLIKTIYSLCIGQLIWGKESVSIAFSHFSAKKELLKTIDKSNWCTVREIICTCFVLFYVIQGQLQCKIIQAAAQIK